ncbi:Hypothetical protein SMAX5B_013002 [Scophthalmus maximus]|uniref:Uncharacterized protein n=1 Tax=Scophthalmus maximus TaxID=52904 RepID=A0A2U9BND9_SCOMX|nr:Hypothetical protein SMAX5B_013002 [Scophthalmus maximus]
MEGVAETANNEGRHTEQDEGGGEEVESALKLFLQYVELEKFILDLGNKELT